MKSVDIYNMQGEVTGQVELSDAVFGVEPNLAVMHQVVKSQLANRRQGTAATKGRSQVRGGGRKPYRQKGTGRARQGSIRAAQWVGGGVIFGPSPRSYRQSIPRKMRRLALRGALSLKAQGNDLLIVDDVAMDQIKTKTFVGSLKALDINESSVLIVTDKTNENTKLSARNVPNVRTELVNTLNVVDVLKYEKLVLSSAALQQIEEVYA